MFEKLRDLLQAKESLLDQARNQALTMLYTCREMFDMVTKAIRQEVDTDIRQTIRRIDRKINHQQRDVRKMVFEHLSLSSSGDLLTGLQLLNIVIDIERIGDYTKNIADLIDMVPKKLDFGEYEDEIHNLEQKTLQIFDLTLRAIEKDDIDAAEKSIDEFDELAKRFNKGLEQIMRTKTEEDMVEKKYLALVLHLRYLKRVNAHLGNIATTTVKPFHRIGYRD